MGSPRVPQGIPGGPWGILPPQGAQGTPGDPMGDLGDPRDPRGTLGIPRGPWGSLGDPRGPQGTPGDPGGPQGTPRGPQGTPGGPRGTLGNPQRTLGSQILPENIRIYPSKSKMACLSPSEAHFPYLQLISASKHDAGSEFHSLEA